MEWKAVDAISSSRCVRFTFNYGIGIMNPCGRDKGIIFSHSMAVGQSHSEETKSKILLTTNQGH